MKYNFTNQIMDFIFSNSYIFDKFRNIIHNDFKAEKKIISKILRKDKRTLDFGCGAGQFSDVFNPDRYHGVDTDKRYIDFCKDNRKGDFFMIKSSPPYKFKKNYFDQIFVSAVIHHINNKKLSSISKEFSRMLKDNGEIMIVDHFRKEKQPNLFCKFLIFLDRGKYLRNPDKAIKPFSKEFKIKRFKVFKNWPYKSYILILKKRL